MKTHGLLWFFSIRDTTDCGCLLPPSCHIYTSDDGREFSAQGYDTIEFFEDDNPVARRVPPAPCPSYKAHSPRRTDLAAFPVSQEEHLGRWCFYYGVLALVRTWARAWG